jgi:hypothetical protein
VQHNQSTRVSQVDEYLRQCGKKLDDLLPRPSFLKEESVPPDEKFVPAEENFLDEESASEEEILPSPDRTYQSTTTGRVRKRPERLQVSHKPTGPKVHCPGCQAVFRSTRAFTYHKKVCKNKQEKSLVASQPHVSPKASNERPKTSIGCPRTIEECPKPTFGCPRTLNECPKPSDGCPRTLVDCPVSIKRPKPSEPPLDNATDAPDTYAEMSDVSSEMSDQFSDMTDECSEWDEVDGVEIKMEYDEDTVLSQEVAMQTDAWCPDAPSAFVCVPCRCHFRTSANLRQHALDAHRESADSTLCTLGQSPSKGIKMIKFVSGVACYYECPCCRTLRVDVAQLLHHMRQQHPSTLSTKSITCRKAPVKIMKSVQLSEIQGERYLCGFCRQHMDTLRLLKIHLEKMHLVKECQRCLNFFQVCTLDIDNKGEGSVKKGRGLSRIGVLNKGRW